MKKLVVVMVSLLFAVAIAANIFAMEQGRGRGEMGMEAMHHDRGGKAGPWDNLNLTDDQKARIRVLREAHLRDVKPHQDQMFSKRGDLKLLWLKQNPNKEDILAVQREIRVLRDQMQDKATAHRVDLFNILTPEQQEKAREAQSKRRPVPPNMPGRMMGPGPGMLGPGPGMTGN